MAAVFPLVPRRRVLGLAFGGVRSARRGIGSDVASTREYRPGDDVGWMDWAASARLSAARGDDEFIVRERFADEAPRVVVLCDRRPSMSIARVAAPPARQAAGAAHRARPDRRRARSRRAASPATSTTRTASRSGARRAPSSAPSRARSTGRSTRRPTRSPGASTSSASTAATCRRRRSSSSSPTSSSRPTSRLAAGARAPLGARAGGRPGPGLGADVPRRRRHHRPVRRPGDAAASCRCTSRESEARAPARRDEARWDGLVRDFRSLGIEPVAVHTHDLGGMLDAFLRWADLRQMWRGALA